MPKHNLAATAKIAQLLNPAADAAGRASRAVSFKNSTMMSILVSIAQGNAAPVTLSLFQSKNAQKLDAKALTEPVPIWVNQDAANTDTLLRGTDGISFTTSAALADKQVLFHLDPAYFDVNNGYGYVHLVTSASNAGNITSALAIAQGNRYMGTNFPSLFT